MPSHIFGFQLSKKELARVGVTSAALKSSNTDNHCKKVPTKEKSNFVALFVLNDSFVKRKQETRWASNVRLQKNKSRRALVVRPIKSSSFDAPSFLRPKTLNVDKRHQWTIG